MKVIFCRSHSIASVLVRLGTWSAWGHCGIVTPDDTVIHALAFQGVTEQPLAQVLERVSEYQILDIHCPNKEVALVWARSQIGKPYDWSAVIGIGFHREWNKPDRWFCSELVEATLIAGGRRRWRNPRRITPQLTWNAE